MAIRFDETINWYNRNAKVYFHKEIIYPEDARQLERFIDVIPKGGRVLDAGCGSGNFTRPMADAGLIPVGIDLSEKLIEMCRQSNPGIDFRKADLRQLPLESNSFDGVWAHASLVHMSEALDALKSLTEFSRILKKGGKLHLNVKKRTGPITEYVIEPRTKEKRFFRYFEEDEIKEMLKKSGFDIVTLDVYNELERNGTMGRSDTDWINIFAQKFNP